MFAQGIRNAPEAGRIPTLHVIGNSIPQALYRAISAVWKQGALMPTEYDRRDDAGNLIDPPGRDACVLIEVKDPFAQPRFPPISWCEIGAYIAEIIGVKDHKVLPIGALRLNRDGHPLPSTEWPYTYHQRLFSHPDVDGDLVDQVALAIERVAQTPYSRRAICTTSVPNLDPFLKEDVPCLREIGLRCPEDKNGELALNPTLTWRSRDLYKAWPDNVIALTFLLQVIAQKISLRSRRPCRLGSYKDFSMSLHIYGQDYSHFNGDPAASTEGFFDTFPDEYSFIAKSLTSECAADMLVLPQLEKLKTPALVEQWSFGEEQIALIDDLIDGITSGRYIC